MATLTQKVHDYMQSAQTLAQGTMEMWVTFPTEEEADIARNWLKGKRKVKNLTILTKKQSDKKRKK